MLTKVLSFLGGAGLQDLIAHGEKINDQKEKDRIYSEPTDPRILSGEATIADIMLENQISVELNQAVERWIFKLTKRLVLPSQWVPNISEKQTNFTHCHFFRGNLDAPLKGSQILAIREYMGNWAKMHGFHLGDVEHLKDERTVVLSFYIGYKGVRK